MEKMKSTLENCKFLSGARNLLLAGIDFFSYFKWRVVVFHSHSAEHLNISSLENGALKKKYIRRRFCMRMRPSYSLEM